jgi:hypothetical protein
MNEIIRLEEDSSETRLSNWVVFKVKLVETME